MQTATNEQRAVELMNFAKLARTFAAACFAIGKNEDGQRALQLAEESQRLAETINTMSAEKHWA